MIRSAIPILAIILASLTVTGGVSDPGYLNVSPGSVVYFQFVNNNGSIAGQLHVATLTADNQVASQVITFSGQIAGSSITLSFGQSIFGTGTTYIGELFDNRLILNTSTSAGYIAKTSYMRASVNDYNSALGRLQANAYSARVQAQAEVAAQQQQAERAAELQQMQLAVSNASDSLSNTLNAFQSDETSVLRSADFKSDFNTYERDLVTMQNDFHIEQKDASVTPFTCGDLGTVNGDVGTVDGDLGTIHGDDGTFTGDKASLAVDVGGLTRDIAEANTRLVALKTAVDNNTSGYMPPHVSGREASQAIALAQQALERAGSRLDAASAQVQSYDQQAEDQDAQAHAFADRLHC